MGNKIVTFKISPDGMKIEVDASGFQGSGCIEYTEKTLKALGEIQEKKEKPEMYGSTGGRSTLRA